MGKNTLRRIANHAEMLARRQGIVQGRRESDEEIGRLGRINRRLLQSLRDMVEWGETAGIADAMSNFMRPRRSFAPPPWLPTRPAKTNCESARLSEPSSISTSELSFTGSRNTD